MFRILVPINVPCLADIGRRAGDVRDAQARGVDNEPRALPRRVVAFDDVLPRRQFVTREIRHARLDTALMLRRIRTDDFDFGDANIGALGDRSPCAARQRPRVDTVGDDRATTADGSAGSPIGPALSTC